ncbi:peptidoglycan editing factor PgeF [Psychrobacter aestuarii]|uniref:Purine nucleoside phosphorylase n=1 Tax=Psychrobacter aestuarii TaxID=556327 RepID=A0ABP3FM64_9GAMM|nr:peptidoglycan editing factor PgeF [Psychrobacter aestuarii]
MSEPLQILAHRDRLLVLQTTTGLAAAASDMLQPQTASYGAFNLGLHVRDDSASVLANRMALLDAVNQYTTAQPITKIQWLNQVHGDTVYLADKAPSLQAPDADALISQRAGQALAIMTADCVPVVLHQPATGQIAAIHAGWQGLANGIIAKTAAQFATDMPIHAWIGACISQDNYEVDMTVAQKLYAGCQQARSVSDMTAAAFVARYSDAPSLSAAKCHIDLPKLAFDQLRYAGAEVQHPLPIDCSYAQTRYYSYRRQTHRAQTATGRMAMVIVRLS